MNFLQVTTKVTPLREPLLTQVTLEWSLPSVRAEMIPQVAALLEDAQAFACTTAVVQLDALCVQISDPDGTMPVTRSVREGFRTELMDCTRALAGI